MKFHHLNFYEIQRFQVFLYFKDSNKLQFVGHWDILTLLTNRSYFLQQRSQTVQLNHLYFVIIITSTEIQLHMKPLIGTFNSKLGPKAIGPYSTATIYQGLMYVSGQLGIDPKTLELVSEDVEQQTKMALKNFNLLLEETNCEVSYVLKTTVFLKNMSDFAKVNSIYAGYFKAHHPARICVAVAQLPKNAKFELQAIVAYPYKHSQLDNDISWS